jgi:cytochrome c oxidase subunit III
METVVEGQHHPDHGPGHGHHDDPYLQHHFHTAAQQFEASKIGMWLFLVTEILLFGGLFTGYGILQYMHPEAFVSAHHHLDRVMGSINTVVLLVSSFTMVMAVWAAQTSRRKQQVMYLTLTLLCAATFMVIKYFEYNHKIHEGLLPGPYYTYTGPHHPQENLFFSFYFMMTGLHGIHVLGGMGAIGWLLYRARKGHFNARYYTPVDLIGLYWHLVDLIWIYLFPLLYLVS